MTKAIFPSYIYTAYISGISLVLMCSLVLNVILLMLNRGLFLGRFQKSMIEPSAKLVNGKWYLVFLVFACESL